MKRLISWNVSIEWLRVDGRLYFCVYILLVLVHMLFYYHFENRVSVCDLEGSQLFTEITLWAKTYWNNICVHSGQFVKC